MSAPRAILLLTRPARDSRAFLDMLDLPDAVETVISPLLEIVPCGVLPERRPAGLIFTSANGVAAWQAAGGAADLPAMTVGPATAEAARRAGFARVTSADGDADALVARVLAEPPAAPLLHVRGAHAKGDIAARLTEAGVPTEEAVLYDQEARALSDSARAALDGPHPVVVALFSSRTASIFALQCEPKERVHAVVISDRVAEALGPDRAATLTVAEAPNGAEMARAVLRVVADVATLESGRDGL